MRRKQSVLIGLLVVAYVALWYFFWDQLPFLCHLFFGPTLTILGMYLIKVSRKPEPR